VALTGRVENLGSIILWICNDNPIPTVYAPLGTTALAEWMLLLLMSLPAIGLLVTILASAQAGAL
jgi:hypothetical protein